ncbi:hypothetical protein [Macrococcoides caseolyticum]|uniref:hypothetical protein n=1 Tax=Macrococcoides caseolyticum TaxID=69966 RepID=UPI001F2C03F0|nr:hypothetical protein [Macrococcus caseolyticus]MCE4956982.1 hypothetical protein [Macrococcus caseolyticus]
MLSLFVMDVSSSTKFNNADEISQQLIQLTIEIEKWTENIPYKYINFRMGDELFFVSSSLSATLFSSYYIKLLWPFKHQPVKFGIAACEGDFPEGNLEHWNAPIIKQARYNLAQIKHSDVSDFYMTIDGQNIDIYNQVVFPYLTEIVRNHSEMQRQAILLSFVYPQQKDIAQALDKGVSTISEHLKKGHKKQLQSIEAAFRLLDDTNEIEPLLKDTFKEYVK